MNKNNSQEMFHINIISFIFAWLSVFRPLLSDHSVRLRIKLF